MNRDLEKVILIDTNPDSCALQPENAIILEKWKGDVRDKELVALIPFLECTSRSSRSMHSNSTDLASQNFDDFRPILTEYKESAAKRHIKIADEFARREAIAREVSPLSFKRLVDLFRHFKKPLNQPHRQLQAPLLFLDYLD